MAQEPAPFTLPRTNENYYELAWAARAGVFFAQAREEGNGKLYRTLKIFERLDRGHKISIPYYHGIDAASGHPTKVYHANVTLAAEPEAESRAYADIFTATKRVVENRKSHRTFAALDYDALPRQWLCEIARDGFDTIVELGAGYGRNLIEIYCHGGPANARYVGAEYTESGRKLMSDFFGLEPGAPFETVFFNHRKPDLAFLKGARKVLLFTRHSIEQVDRLPEDYFDILAACAPEVVAVHFEPFGFQCPGQWKLSKTHRGYIKSRNYNLNLVKTLRGAERRKRLKVRWLAPDVINPHDINPTSVVLWDNRGP